MDWLVEFTKSQSFGIIMFTMLFINMDTRQEIQAIYEKIR